MEVIVESESSASEAKNPETSAAEHPAAAIAFGETPSIRANPSTWLERDCGAGGWGVGCRQFIDAIQRDVTNSEIPASAAVARLARRFHVDHPGVIMVLLLFPVSPLEHQQATNFVLECKGGGCTFL